MKSREGSANDRRRCHGFRRRLSKVDSVKAIKILLISASLHSSSGFSVGQTGRTLFQPSRTRNQMPPSPGYFFSSPGRQTTATTRVFRRPGQQARSSCRLAAVAIPVSSILPKSILPVIYMVLLALQFAVQPVLTKKFAPKTIIRSTYVLAQDCARLSITAVLLTATHSWNTACQNWTWQAAVATAGFPALLYLIQSYCSLTAYQNLAPITYNVLNQTKTLSAAVCCFLLFGQRQSLQQGIALGILLLAALVMESIVKVPFLAGSDVMSSTQQQPVEKSNAESVAEKAAAKSTYLLSGVLPILVASMISGLAGAWTQRSLRASATSNNSLLFTLQLSVFSILLMGTTLLVPGLSPDRERARKEGWSVGWSVGTWIPIAVNATGGVLVGLVTKFSGVVPKGFALIVGMFLSGVLQNRFSEKNVSAQQWVGGLLAAVSIWMHSAYPYVAKVVG